MFHGFTKRAANFGIYSLGEVLLPPRAAPPPTSEVSWKNIATLRIEKFSSYGGISVSTGGARLGARLRTMMVSHTARGWK